ncbi:hypothetical protein HS088_TW09G01224 [Tripterygium wilfordii]|uniref:Uncharacterized protein n=1 Tax=Tripterygium wilfordii TaxID=458696 RepID=A0A7J7DA76_TRIWF|nr:hypothetical protein HS088_TW09G01224 [Tripterygium wilfordii]
MCLFKCHSRPLTNNDKNGCIEHEEHAREGNNKYDNHKLLQHFDQGSSKNLDNRLFNELEAIYGLSNMGEANQTASGSALTWENSTTNAKLSLLFGHVNGQNVAARGTANAAIGVDHESETSLGEEAALRKSQKRKRKWKVKENLGYITWCLENFVKQVIDHQEKLHCMFLGVIEKMEKERAEREEAWRRQEVALHNREAMARAHEQILAWSLIAGRLPGRTDNEIKNYWNTSLGKRAKLAEPSPPQSPQLANEPKTTNPSTSSQAPQVIRTKAIRCTKVSLPITPLPPPPLEIQTTDQLQRQSRTTLSMDDYLNVEDCGNIDLDFLNFEVGASDHGINKDLSSIMGSDQQYLPFEHEDFFFVDNDDDANLDLESLELLLNSDEWPEK